jgi:hypothetical protein
MRNTSKFRWSQLLRGITHAQTPRDVARCRPTSERKTIPDVLVYLMPAFRHLEIAVLLSRRNLIRWNIAILLAALYPQVGEG